MVGELVDGEKLSRSESGFSRDVVQPSHGSLRLFLPDTDGGGFLLNTVKRRKDPVISRVEVWNIIRKIFCDVKCTSDRNFLFKKKYALDTLCL